jgi:hypothetical protein
MENMFPDYSTRKTFGKQYFQNGKWNGRNRYGRKIFFAGKLVFRIVWRKNRYFLNGKLVFLIENLKIFKPSSIEEHFLNG